jgi:hypothetical protein
VPVKKIILATLLLNIFATTAFASPIFCNLDTEFSFENLVFKKSKKVESGFIVYVRTTSGMTWMPAYEGFIEKRNGFRLRGIVEAGKTFKACGDINSDGMAITKISEQ